MGKVFTIVVDVQNDFMRRYGKLYVPGAVDIITNIQDYLVHIDIPVVFDEEMVGVLFTFDTHFEETYPTSEEAKQFPIHCVKGTDGWQLAVDPSVIKNVTVYSMEKGVFDMWKEPDLCIDRLPREGVMINRDTFFENLKAIGVKKIRIIGVAADYCVKWAADGALEQGFDVEIISRLTVGIQRGIEQVVAEDYAGRAVTLI